MSGLTSLVDTLLATRLAQRPDLLPLKSQVTIPGPGAVAGVEKITNDVRLPSRAALERSLAPGLSGQGDEGTPSMPPGSGPGRGVTLSTVARAIGALLGTPDGTDNSVKLYGADPLWSRSQPPPADLLAARLADTVATSGLFYESHLRQLAVGTRPLAQLLREPQAGLLPVELAGDSPAASHDGAAPVTTPLEGPGTTGSADGKPVSVYHRDGTTGHPSTGFHELAGQDTGEAATLAGSHRSAADPVAASIHPEAMALVRQQLELLAVPVFRWCGEAWPGASLDWDIHEESSDPASTGEEETKQPAWTTHLSMTLPALKSLDVRVTLAGNTLQVRLASSAAALPLLLTGRQPLSARLEALDLHVALLQLNTAEGDIATAMKSGAAGQSGPVA
jgi:hypothetical protein